MAENEEEEECHLVQGGVIIRWQYFILFYLNFYTWHSCVKIRQSCECWAAGP